MTGAWRRAAVPALLVLVLASAAEAQPAPQSDSDLETVIVTAPELSDALKAAIPHFIASFAAPAPVSDEIPRWDRHRPLCARAYGFANPGNNDMITMRVRQDAAKVGAPLSSSDNCKPNVEIFFTSEPQRVVDFIREHGGSLLLNSKPSQAQKAAVVAHPIQAWYATMTRDICGTMSFDNEDSEAAIIVNNGCPPANSGQYAVEGSRLKTGLQSLLGHVYIVVDVSQTSRTMFGAVADYIAMIALSRTQDFETCQPLPSIANLMSGDCDASRKVTAMTSADLAFLTGIYKMDPTASLVTQRSTIASEVKAALGSE